MKREEVVYTYRGQIERGGMKSGYRWSMGYSATPPGGGMYYPWNTKKECQSEAKRVGKKAVFVDRESA